MTFSLTVPSTERSPVYSFLSDTDGSVMSKVMSIVPCVDGGDGAERGSAAHGGRREESELAR